MNQNLERDMPLTLKDMMAAANAVVARIDTKDAQKMIAEKGALLLDIRDAPELERLGRATGAHHIPRGMLEFRADADGPYHDPELRFDRPVLLFCASGGRAALAGKLLLDMGYEKVFNIGGLKDWKEAGGPVEEPVDPGM
jgi:rhodanese-related sulfurtransferase